MRPAAGGGASARWRLRLRVAALVAGLATLLWAAAPVRAAAPPSLSVTAAALYVPATGQVLYADRAQAELPVASTTKLMTALVTLEHVRRLSTVFRQMDFVAPSIDSQIGLVPGEPMSVHDLLLALMLPSADDAAIDLAYNVGRGSVARFVAMMNVQGRRLGLAHTHYANPIGLDEAGNYSSALDLDRLAAYDMQHSPYFRRIVALPAATLFSGYHVRRVINRDGLVDEVPWINGVKTGHTAGAGYVLVSSGMQHGLWLIGSVLGTSSEAARNANALALMQWGYRNFRLVNPVMAGRVLARPEVNDDPAHHVPVVAAAGVERVVGADARVLVHLHVPKDLNGPLARGAAVGSVTVRLGPGQSVTVPLRLGRAIPGVSALTQAVRSVGGPITLIMLALGVGAGAAVVASRRRRPHPAVQ